MSLRNSDITRMTTQLFQAIAITHFTSAVANPTVNSGQICGTLLNQVQPKEWSRRPVDDRGLDRRPPDIGISSDPSPRAWLSAPEEFTRFHVARSVDFKGCHAQTGEGLNLGEKSDMI
jgi:hypothetical protein